MKPIFFIAAAKQFCNCLLYLIAADCVVKPLRCAASHVFYTLSAASIKTDHCPKPLLVGYILMLALGNCLYGQPIAHITATNISENLYWTNDSIYLVENAVTLMPGYSLTICPGTTVKFAAHPEFRTGLRIARGAQIYADGSEAPIVFTSNFANPQPGDWFGIAILGAAPESCDGSPFGPNCLDFDPGALDTLSHYGEGSPDDNSGILRCVRIEYAGGSFWPSQDSNPESALILAGVGTGTIIDRVEVFRSDEIGFIFSGGSVNCKHLISNQNLHDDFRFLRGYTGHSQFLCSIRDPFLAVSGNSAFRFQFPCDPKLSNITVAGPTGSGIDPDYNQILRMHSGLVAYGIFNSVFLGEYPFCIRAADNSVFQDYLNQDSIEIKNTLFAGPNELVTGLIQTPSNVVTNWFNQPSFNNTLSPDPFESGLQDPFNTTAPNLLPFPGSLVWGQSNFTNSVRLQDPFFDQVNFIGAFGTEDWTQPWASWHNWTGNLPNCTSSAVDAKKGGIALPKLSPQPASATVNCSEIPWDISNNPLNIDVFDALGQKMPTPAYSIITDHSLAINTSQLPSGYYLIRIRTSNGAGVTTKCLILR